YASRALLSLSLHAGEAGPTSVRDIAERTGLPQPYLEQILLALKGAGLVRSKRGVGGGYVLAREPSTITLGDIVSAVDGPITVGDFGEPHQNGACDHEGQCVLLAIWGVLGEHMRRHLDELTLADIARMARGERDWPVVEPVDRRPCRGCRCQSIPNCGKFGTTSAQCRQYGRQFVRQRGVEREGLAGDGVLQRQVLGVQPGPGGRQRGAAAAGAPPPHPGGAGRRPGNPGVV